MNFPMPDLLPAYAEIFLLTMQPIHGSAFPKSMRRPVIPGRRRSFRLISPAC